MVQHKSPKTRNVIKNRQGLWGYCGEAGQLQSADPATEGRVSSCRYNNISKLVPARLSAHTAKSADPLFCRRRHYTMPISVFFNLWGRPLLCVIHKTDSPLSPYLQDRDLFILATPTTSPNLETTAGNFQTD
jgi:hypothetical protein